MRETKKGKKERRFYTSPSETNKVVLSTMVVREKRRDGGGEVKRREALKGLKGREGGKEDGGREESGRERLPISNK